MKKIVVSLTTAVLLLACGYGAALRNGSPQGASDPQPGVASSAPADSVSGAAPGDASG